MNHSVINAQMQARDGRTALGQTYIRDRWAHLRAETREYLMAGGYDERGGRSGADDWVNDTRGLEYALGLFREATASSVPTSKGDPVPLSLAGDDVLNEAANLVLDRNACDPVFARAAIHAIIRQQTSRTLDASYSAGGSSLESGSRLGNIGRILAILFLGFGFFISIGNGLAAAFRGDGMTASLYVLLALIAVGYFNWLKEKAQKPEKVAYRKWSSLLYLDSHIGTGHGLQVKLEEMVRQGLNVPSVLFDLCAVLHRDARI